MLVTKQGKTKCNNETATFLAKNVSFFFFFFFFYNPISVSEQMKQLRYIEKTLKQDETDQKTMVNVTKQGETQ